MSDYFTQEEKTYKIDKLARDVLLLSRNTLLVNLRFLDAALSQFEFAPLPIVPFGTNGKALFYTPAHVLTTYTVEKEIPVRDYLHMVMHCVFQHIYWAPKMDPAIWNLACDIAVEYSISGLGLKAAQARREKEEAPVFSKLIKEVGKITAEKVYEHFMAPMISDEELNNLQKIFTADDHAPWYWTESKSEEKMQDAGVSSPEGDESENEPPEGNGSGNEPQEGNGSGNEPQEGNGSGNEPPKGGGGAGNKRKLREDFSPEARAAQSQVWKDIAERMQMDMETFQKSKGDTAGNLLQNLQAVNREKYDYGAFLKKFAVRGEVMKINDDEFDYVFYTYGLKLYDKMPLIEPLEYKEVKRIREFVIAIDTSGSVHGKEVQSFVQKTYNILKSSESFFSKINLHIIQCDEKIQEHVKVTSQEEFDEYLSKMKLKGFGGTDFRPVFRKVDELVKNKEFQNLKGLIYFTDGYGSFPEKKPDYETAFVFVNDEYESPRVPSWAIKLVLQRGEL